MNHIVFTAVAALALLASAPAQESYRITLKEPAQGDTTLHHKLTHTRLESIRGKERVPLTPKSGHDRKVHLEYRQTVQEKPAGAQRPTKLRRRYSRAEQTQGDTKQAFTYHGKTLLLEWKDGRCTVRMEDGDLPARERRLFGEQGNGPVAFPHPRAAWLPRKPVRVGEGWDIDAPRLLRDRDWWLGIDLDAERAEGSGKLLRTYEKAGRRYGVFELFLSVPPTKVKVGSKASLFLKDSRLTVRMVVDGCIDGSSFAYRVKGVIEQELNGQREKDGGSKDIRLRTQVDFFESREEAGKAEGVKGR
jgi:hypothetical protein